MLSWGLEIPDSFWSKALSFQGKIIIYVESHANSETILRSQFPRKKMDFVSKENWNTATKGNDKSSPRKHPRASKRSWVNRLRYQTSTPTPWPLLHWVSVSFQKEGLRDSSGILCTVAWKEPDVANSWGGVWSWWLGPCFAITAMSSHNKIDSLKSQKAHDTVTESPLRPWKCKSRFSNRALVEAIFEALKCL